MKLTYKEAGVDIEAGDKIVKQIAPLIKETHSERVLSNIGLFGGFYDAKFPNIEHPVLVASTDGVGTKLKIAFAMNKHNTIGQCLVNHCVNDILCCGAKPLFFLDYFATGKLNTSNDTNLVIDVIEGFTIACKENNCALIGGETAEMPSIYNDNEYDISGTIIGIIDKNKIVNGSKIEAGNIMVGLQSTGLHTNGYSLVRTALFPKYDVNTYINELGQTIGDALLTVHRSYLQHVEPLIDKKLLTGISHITGGGLISNTSRIMPKELQMNIDWNAWERPVVFDFIQKEGNIGEEEMRKVFNLGVGMVLIADKKYIGTILEQTKEYTPIVIGEVGNLR